MDINALLEAFNTGSVAVRNLAVAVCSTVLGWWLMGTAGQRMVNWNNPRRQYGWPSIAARFVVGTMFVNASQYLNMQVLTWTGAAMPAANAMSLMPGGGGGSVPKMIFQTTLLWMATMGVIAILKGTSLIVKAAEGNSQQQEDPAWTAAVYIVSGSIGVNLWRFVNPFV